MPERERLSGVWTAMPTPWTADFSIDAGVVRELVGRYAAFGVHGAYTTGTDGEMHVMELVQFRALAEAFGPAAQEAMLPVQMGCTWSHTAGVIERARIAQDNGIRTIQVALPSWIPLSDQETLGFFEAIHTALPDMWIVHYNIARAGRFLPGDDYRAILEVAPNLIGSKQTGGDVASLIECVQATPELDHFVVDGQIVPGALFGARGFYSFLANLAPHIALQLWELCEQRRWDAAARLRERIDHLFRAWLGTTGDVSASSALGKIATGAGILPGMPLEVRAPYRSGDATQVASLRTLIQESFPEFTVPDAH
jgi:dihydrodipicolinate synthase/N-acetylneuraminate lyase